MMRLGGRVVGYDGGGIDDGMQDHRMVSPRSPRHHPSFPGGLGVLCLCSALAWFVRWGWRAGLVLAAGAAKSVLCGARV